MVPVFNSTAHQIPGCFTTKHGMTTFELNWKFKYDKLLWMLNTWIKRVCQCTEYIILFHNMLYSATYLANLTEKAEFTLENAWIISCCLQNSQVCQQYSTNQLSKFLFII